MNDFDGLVAVITGGAGALERQPPGSSWRAGPASAVALLGVPDRALYSASKGAVLALTLAMAADHVQDGIRVNAVAPGTTETPWVAAPDPAAAATALQARQPLGRLGLC